MASKRKAKEQSVEKKSSARKTSTVPTRVYTYGCLPPTKGLEVLEQQLRRAFRYYNVLVDIEHDRRQQVDALWAEIPTVQAALAELDRLYEAQHSARRAVSAKRAGVGRGADTSEESVEAKGLKKQIEKAWKVVKKSKASISTDDKMRFEAATALLKETAKRRQKEERARCGLRFGTYLDVEHSVDQAVKAAAPALPRRRAEYDGTGTISVQFQPSAGDTEDVEGLLRRQSQIKRDIKSAKTRKEDTSALQSEFDSLQIEIRSRRFVVGKVMGLGVEELFSGEDSRLRIDPIPADTFDRRRHHRRLASRTKVHFYAAAKGKQRALDGISKEDGWVELPVIFHRPLPSDAVIKWARICRRRVGYHFRYELQLVVESRTFAAPERDGSGMVAFDVGWRRYEEGGRDAIRVGMLGDDRLLDEVGEPEEVRVPDGVVFALAKVDDLEAIRDKNFNFAVGCLRQWVIGRDVPEWLSGKLAHAHQWRAQSKLASLHEVWKSARFTGDEEIFAGVEAWAKKDRHLQAWAAHQRSRVLGHRREEYRKIAARIARKYGTIVIEDGVDLAGFRKKRAPEDGVPSDGGTARSNAVIGAPGEFRACLVAAAEKYGAKIVRVDPAYTSRQCSYCGCVAAWENSSERVHKCSGCGRTWDRDVNACRNLLRRGREASTSVTGG